MDTITTDFLDLGDINGGNQKCLLLRTGRDILQNCKVAGHLCDECTAYDQVASAMANVVTMAPSTVFQEVATKCTCTTALTPTQMQCVTPPGMGGLMCVAKEITDRNKQYLEKRWSAFCASAGTKSEITAASMIALIGMLIEAQPRLYQTQQGRIFAERVIAADTNPPKVKDQVNMVYHYTGMKSKE